MPFDLQLIYSSFLEGSMADVAISGNLEDTYESEWKAWLDLSENWGQKEIRYSGLVTVFWILII